MKETSWQRLHRIAVARIEHLGYMQKDLPTLGGPSVSWLRGLPSHDKPPSGKHNRALIQLDHALQWTVGTSRGLLVEDRKGFSAADLRSEEAELVQEHAEPVPQMIAAFQTAIGRHLMNLAPEVAAEVMRKVAVDLRLDLS